MKKLILTLKENKQFLNRTENNLIVEILLTLLLILFSILTPIFSKAQKGGGGKKELCPYSSNSVTTAVLIGYSDLTNKAAKHNMFFLDASLHNKTKSN